MYTKALVYQPEHNKHSTFTVSEVITVHSADNFQREIFTLHDIANNFGLEISPENSETVSFAGQDPVRCKIIVDSKCLQKVKNVKCLL